MDHLKYKQIKIQKYFNSNKIDKYDGQQLFKCRTRMTNFAANFPNGALNIQCPLCKKENSIDSDEHSFQCEIVQTLVPETIDKSSKNIYSKNIDKMKETAKIFKKILDLRSELNI